MEVVQHVFETWQDTAARCLIGMDLQTALNRMDQVPWYIPPRTATPVHRAPVTAQAVGRRLTLAALLQQAPTHLQDHPASSLKPSPWAHPGPAKGLGVAPPGLAALCDSPHTTAAAFPGLPAVLPAIHEPDHQCAAGPPVASQGLPIVACHPPPDRLDLLGTDDLIDRFDANTFTRSWLVKGHQNAFNKSGVQSRQVGNDDWPIKSAHLSRSETYQATSHAAAPEAVSGCCGQSIACTTVVGNEQPHLTALHLAGCKRFDTGHSLPARTAAQQVEQHDMLESYTSSCF